VADNTALAEFFPLAGMGFSVYNKRRHNGSARIAQSYFTDMTNGEFAAFGIGNCQALEYEW